MSDAVLAHAPDRRPLRVIAAFKGAKSAALLVVAAAAFGLLGDATPRRLQVTGLIAVGYAGMLAVEGVGLWLARGWAEWYSVGVTASLIPFELWELARRATAPKGVVLGLNVAAVAYLVWRLRREARLRAR